MLKPPDDATCVRFIPGGDVLSVERGSVPVDPGSRTYRDVFAPGPGWIFGVEEATDVRWAGMTRDAERNVIFAAVEAGTDGGSAWLWACDAVAEARRGQDVVAGFAHAIRQDASRAIAAITTIAHGLLDDAPEDPAEVEADITAAGRSAVQLLDELQLLRLGQAALMLIDERALGRPLPAPFRRGSVALVPHSGHQDLTAVGAALADLGFSLSEIPDQDETVLAHLERTRMHAAVVVLEPGLPLGDLDRWIDQTLGDVIRVELRDLAPARFRTTPEGRLQLDRDLSPGQVVDALRRHAEARGIPLG